MRKAVTPAVLALGTMLAALPALAQATPAKVKVGVLTDMSGVYSDITGKVHRDRKLLTGDSPLASNNLGKLAADTLLSDVAKR